MLFFDYTLQESLFLRQRERMGIFSSVLLFASDDRIIQTPTFCVFLAAVTFSLLSYTVAASSKTKLSFYKVLFSLLWNSNPLSECSQSVRFNAFRFQHLVFIETIRLNI